MSVAAMGMLWQWTAFANVVDVVVLSVGTLYYRIPVVLRGDILVPAVRQRLVLSALIRLRRC